MNDRLGKILSPGNDVLIIVPDDYYFHGTDGVVKSIGDEKVTVEFGKEHHSIFSQMGRFAETTAEFPSNELQIIDIADYLEIRATRMYGSNYFHHLCRLPYRFSFKNDCMHHDCSKKSTKRIIFNAWGTVCEYDVCDEHAESDGCCGDGFFMKNNYHAEEKLSIQ